MMGRLFCIILAIAILPTYLVAYFALNTIGSPNHAAKHIDAEIRPFYRAATYCLDNPLARLPIVRLDAIEIGQNHLVFAGKTLFDIRVVTIRLEDRIHDNFRSCTVTWHVDLP